MARSHSPSYSYLEKHVHCNFKSGKASTILSVTKSDREIFKALTIKKPKINTKLQYETQHDFGDFGSLMVKSFKNILYPILVLLLFIPPAFMPRGI